MASMGIDKQLHSYIGYFDSQPVCTASMFLSDQIAGIYNIATLPAARGKGLGSAITLAPLLEARQMGYQIGALQSSEMGFRLYERIGFRKVCEMIHFAN
jgi:ribosomal protein S18 acetylase RimI-like enzyme